MTLTASQPVVIEPTIEPITLPPTPVPVSLVPAPRIKANIKELRSILDYIEHHQRKWDQSKWASRSWCGSTYCFAGHAVVRAGGKVLNVRGDPLVKDDNGKTRIIAEMAIDVLGLTVRQAEQLFRGTNSLHDLRRVIDGIEAGWI